nr:MAG TPA: hypothetical protein [Caudoviricetes sp.]
MALKKLFLSLSLWSLSSRRAWIEIALCIVRSMKSIRSLSSRRAWIEIYVFVTLTIKNCGRTVKKFLLTCIVKRCINIYISCSYKVVVYEGFVVKIHIAHKIIFCIIFYSIIPQEYLSFTKFLL